MWQETQPRQNLFSLNINNSLSISITVYYYLMLILFIFRVRIYMHEAHLEHPYAFVIFFPPVNSVS
jgi:hypothetical protein